MAIRAACDMLGDERLPGCDLYVTLEPCTMCAAAISFARIRRLYFGAADPKGGAVESGVRFYGQPTCHHAPEVYGGLREEESRALLRLFLRRAARAGRAHAGTAHAMIRVTNRIELDEGEIGESFVRASGPGGQNVNKVSTAVELRFDAYNSPAIEDRVFLRLKVLAGRRMTLDGVIVIDAQRFRTARAEPGRRAGAAADPDPRRPR